jgi:hypothetical protein
MYLNEEQAAVLNDAMRVPTQTLGIQLATPSGTLAGVASVKALQYVTPPGLDVVVMDMTHATDCCVLSVAELSLSSHIQDAEVTCKSCRTTYRYVPNVDNGTLVWRWQVPQAYRARKTEELHFVGDALRAIAQRSQLYDTEGEGE